MRPLHRPLGRAGHRARLEARTTLVPTLRREFAKHTRAEVIERAVAHGVPVAPHNDFEALLADRQVWDNDYVVERHGHVHVGVAAQFEKTKAGVRGPPPALGEHTRQILKEAGLTDEEIEMLLEQRAVMASKL